MSFANQPVLHSCRIHHRRPEPLMFLCLSEACIPQGLLCFYCRTQRHSSETHDVKSLGQLYELAENTSRDKLMQKAIREHVRLIKQARQKHLSLFQEARTKFEHAIAEAERTANLKFDQLERDTAAQSQTFQEIVPDLNPNQPTAELNAKAIKIVQALRRRGNRARQIDNLNKEAIVVVKKCKQQGSEEIARLSQLLHNKLVQSLGPIDSIETSLRSSVESAAAFRADQKQPQLKSAAEYFQRGVEYYQMKSKFQALLNWEKALQLKPDYPEAHNCKGVLYYEMGEQAKALEEYNRGIKWNPNFVEAYCNRGNLYLDMRQQDKAMEDFNRALQLKPNYHRAFCNRASLYKNLGQFDLALKDYNTAIQIKPKMAEAYYGRGNVYKTMGQLDNALKDYEKATELNPNYASAIKNQTAVLEKMEKTDRSYK